MEETLSDCQAVINVDFQLPNNATLFSNPIDNVQTHDVKLKCTVDIFLGSA